LLDSGQTSNPYYARIGLARTINTVMGGALIAPWEIDDLDDVWLDAFRVLAFEGENYRQQAAVLKKVKQDWLNKHPTYGKH
jgi:hypothetical protein